MPDILLDVGSTTNYPGECNIDKFTGLIVCQSFSVGANQPLDPGRGTNRTLGTMNLSEVTISRQFDKTSVPLLNAMFSATIFATIKFHFLKAAAVSGEGHAEFLTVQLDNALISNIQTSGGAGGDTLMETLSFGFTKIGYTYQVQDEVANTVSGNQNATFDMYTQVSTHS
jgi:type VI secretion system Hcp family effector